MRRCLMIGLLLSGLLRLELVQAAPGAEEPVRARLDVEFEQLRSDLEIPGLAYVVVRGDQVLWTGNLGTRRDSTTPFTSSDTLRVASVTKALTGLLALKLADAGKVNLDATASTQLPSGHPGADVPGSVLIRHLLSHSSEGVPGEEYVYSSSRYALLGPILEQASGRTLEDLLREELLEPAGAAWFDSPFLGAHAGLVSNVDNMGRVLQALLSGKADGIEPIQRLAEPARSRYGKALPVSLGWFTQEILGQRALWSFGHDDPDHSGALLMLLPEQELGLFILANDNRLSDPFRLLMGDLRKSPFAMAFLRLMVFSDPGNPLPPATIDTVTPKVKTQGDERIARGLVALWRGNPDQAARWIGEGWSGEPDPVLQFAAVRLPPGPLKGALTRMGAALARERPSNRWIRLAQGYLEQQAGRDSQAAEHFRAILELPNQHPDRLRTMFQSWSLYALAEIYLESNPELARQSLQQLLELKPGDDAEKRARALLESMDSQP